jgi:DNA polymerase III delta prime subunit
MERNYSKYPKNMEDMHNLVFYGPPGSGKYTQVLRFLKNYSPSELKYEKRVTVTSNKVTGYYKISDVHMEVDMGMLGCNSKGIWHDIFTHVNDMLNAKSKQVGFVVCDLENIKNIKDTFNVTDMYETICGKIISQIEADEISKWSDFRDHIYDIFTYNIDVHKCVWKILYHVLSHNDALNKTSIMEKTYTFLKLFNNNYRPIYHLEGYFLFLKMEIMKLSDVTIEAIIDVSAD